MASSAGLRQPDTDDGDMEFELATEESTPLSLDEDDVDDGETILYFDAEEGTAGDAAGEEFSFELASESEVNESEEQEEEDGDEAANEPRAAATATPRGYRTITVTPQQILQLLSQAGLRGVLHGQPTGMMTRSQANRARASGDDEDEEDDDDDADHVEERYHGYGARRRRRRGYTGDRYPKIPSEEGKKLMESGTFGANDRCDHSACGLPFSHTTIRRRRRLARRMLDRELGLTASGFSQRPTTLNALTSQDLLPSTRADMVVSMNAPCYSGQFSEDGSFFFACGKDFRVRMYDTTNPYDWRYYKTVHYYGGQWTITDASLSPDNKLLAYSSIRPQVCLANTDQGDTSEPRMIDFSDIGAGGGHHTGRWGNIAHFGVWSLRFSGDGTEIVAGTSDQSVYVYDLEVGRSVLRIPGHTEDVNAVCYGDKLSPHILYSGSDDTTLKVWDRRSLASMRPAGMFLGHTEGLTYVDSKGDGRYVISNGKDQTCKLWDLRKMIPTDAGERINPQDYTTNFDYRYSPYDVEDHVPHPHDCSLVTFYGHRVLKTLIRCHFSPIGSTNGRYIYSGSHGGKVHIWNLDGTTAGKIDVNAATKPRSATTGGQQDDQYHGGRVESIVRDCSWHPSAPVIVATSWSGWDHGSGTCTVHSWTDGSDADEVNPDDASWSPSEAHASAASLGSAPMGSRVTAQLSHDARFYATPSTPSRTSARTAMLRNRMGLGALWTDDDEEEDEDFIDQGDDNDDDDNY